MQNRGSFEPHPLQLERIIMSEERTNYNAGPIRPECENPASLCPQPTPDEVRALIQILGMSNAQVARFVGVNDGKQVRRWKSGETKIPFAIWGILMAASGRPGCIDKNALEVAKSPRFMDLISDIEDIQIGTSTKVNSILGTRVNITHYGHDQSGLDLIEYLDVDVKGLSNIEALELVTEKIKSFY